MGSALPPAEAEQVKSEWLNTLGLLYRDVDQWVRDQGWEVAYSDKEIREEALGEYHAPVMKIDTPAGRLMLEPIGRVVFGGRGVIELYAWPSLFRVRLLRKTNDEGWDVLTDSGLKWPEPWSEANFVQVARGLLAA